MLHEWVLLKESGGLKTFKCDMCGYIFVGSYNPSKDGWLLVVDPILKNSSYLTCEEILMGTIHGA
jgi:hypothetical protein